MVCLIFLVIAAVTSASFLPSRTPEPGELALLLNEEDFEDYLDNWLKQEESLCTKLTEAEFRNTSGCTIRVNGDLGQPQPVYIHKNDFLTPTGNTGSIHLSTGEQVKIACTGSGRTIKHPNVTTSIATGIATCVNDALVSGAGWLTGNSSFGQLTCSSHSYYEALATTERCYNNNIVIRVGFTVNNVFYPLYWSCFDQSRLEVLYVWYEQNPSNAVHQIGVDRPSWLAGSFFPGVNINNLYTQVTQKATIAGLVGLAMADQYITNTQFLARGHLAAKTDFIYALNRRFRGRGLGCSPPRWPNAGWLTTVHNKLSNSSTDQI